MQTERAAISRPPPPQPTQRTTLALGGSDTNVVRSRAEELTTQRLYHTTSAIDAVNHGCGSRTRSGRHSPTQVLRCSSLAFAQGL
jgi:hypothetical protein